MNKKSESLPLNTIIIAALVLIVLIVLVAIFSGKLNIFGKSYTETTSGAQKKVCWSQPGRCVSLANECTDGIHDTTTNYVDCGEGQGCCIKR